MSKKWLSKVLIAGAIVVGASVVGVTPANAQTASPPGFTDCPAIGGPQGNQYRDLPAPIGWNDNGMWAGLRHSYGPGLFGAETGFTDKIVADDANHRYIHARWRSDTNTWKRMGCKPKPANEKREDVPRFHGGLNDGSNALYLEIQQIRYTFMVAGGMTFKHLPPKYGDVGPVEQVR